MTQATIVMCIKDTGAFEQVLIARHQRGPGKGKLNFPGGGIEEGDTPESCAVKELYQELGLRAKEEDLEKVGLIDFRFESQLRFSCHVFFLRCWEGEPSDSEEMVEHHWCLTSRLPYKQMWVADAEWVPLVIEGSKIKAQVDYNFDGTKIKSFGYSAYE